VYRRGLDAFGVADQRRAAKVQVSNFRAFGFITFGAAFLTDRERLFGKAYKRR
jgi:hypothetical protein